jgi:hypothetical protein
LQDLDAAISGDPHGTIDWTIAEIRKESPAIIAFAGRSRLLDLDHTPKVQTECMQGIRILTESEERPAYYPDATVMKLRRLGELQMPRRKDRLQHIEVFMDSDKVAIGLETVRKIRSLMEPRFESVGSVVGNLDSISIHSGTEFRVWDEFSGYAVTCRFPKELFDKVKEALGHRVLAFGLVKANYIGQKRLVMLEGLEPYPKEAELPTIEEMSGLVDDLTGGLSLKDYLEEIRNG